MSEPTAASDPLLGRTLAQFRVDAKLGEGGMGVVYRATDERLRREVALKVLPEGVAADPERRRRFVREARAAAAVTHPNIAAVYDIGEAEGHVFIAMELVQGETLRARMAVGLTHADSLRIALEVARGLARAHEAGVVHRDLKPENVMVAPDGGVKILDFGLAKVVDAPAGVSGAGATASQLTADGRVMGTPPYMSPEQVEGRAEIDARSDVFSFGAMLYEMLAGVRPFRGDTSIAVLYAVLHGAPTPLLHLSPDVPVAAAEVVARCLRKEKDARFASGGELAAALAGEAAARVSHAPGRSLPAPRVSAISGLGTALGATVAADAPRVDATGVVAESDTSATRRRPVWPWVVTGGLVSVVAIGAMLGPPHSKGAPMASSALAAPSASAGPPLRCNADATRLFDEGVETWEIRSTIDAATVFERAVEADRSCAPALLRLALYSGGRPASLVRSYFAEARAHRDRLTEGEVALLNVVAPPSGDLPDAGPRLEALRAVAHRFPDDALIHFVFGEWAALANAPGAKAAFERVLALRPRSGPAYGALAELASSMQERQELLRRCAEVAPRHAWCDALRGDALLAGFDCHALERFARDVVARNPGRQASSLLVKALAANDASNEALDEALRQMRAGVPGFETLEVASEVAALEGDAPTVETLLRADPRANDNDLDVRAAWVTELAILLDETGRDADADKLVRQTLRTAPALVPAANPTQLADFYARAIAARALSRSEVDAALGPAPPTRDASTAWWTWVSRQLFLASTVDDARKALATMPERPAKPWGREFDGHVEYQIARVRALTGDFAGARRDVDSALKHCNVLSWVDYRPRAFYLLGEASEHTGDLDAARTAYETVVAKWGHLKPKAVLADRARARLAALGHPSVGSR